MSNQPAPTHVAIIMDGNGRWAQSRGLPVKLGHRQGADALKNLLRGCRELGLAYLTVYAFSSENWNRPEDEVSDLMDLLRHYLRHEVKELHKNEIRLRFIGNRDALSPAMQKELNEAETLTANHDGFTLIVALSYGSRQEIVNAAKKLAQSNATEIDEVSFAALLGTSGIPDPDLLIRTGGEQRLSNFLLWQAAYAELYFSDTLWPDFTAQHLKEAYDWYAQRERRFGTRKTS